MGVNHSHAYMVVGEVNESELVKHLAVQEMQAIVIVIIIVYSWNLVMTSSLKAR